MWTVPIANELLPFYARYENVVSRLFVADSTRAGEVALDWAEEMAKNMEK